MGKYYLLLQLMKSLFVEVLKQISFIRMNKQATILKPSTTNFSIYCVLNDVYLTGVRKLKVSQRVL